MDNRTKEHLKSHHPELLKNMLIGEGIKKYINDHPNTFDGFDLNPHFQILAVCKFVKDYIANDFDCTNEDVLLYWLTSFVFDINKDINVVGKC